MINLTEKASTQPYQSTINIDSVGGCDMVVIS